MSQTYGFNEETGIFLNPPPGAGSTWEFSVSTNDDDTELVACLYDPDEEIDEDDDSEDLRINTGIKYTEAQQNNNSIWVQCVYRTFIKSVSHGTVTESFPSSEGDIDDTWVDNEYIVNRDLTFSVWTYTIQQTVKGSTTTQRTTSVENIYTSMKHFCYEIGTGNSNLDSLVKVEKIADLFPTICLRRNKNNIIDKHHKNTAYYKKSKKLFKKIPLFIDDVWDALAKNDLSDIRWIFFTPGVPSNTIQRTSFRYYYDFFVEMVEATTGKPIEESEGKSIRIRNMSYTHNGLTLHYSFGNVVWKRVSGSVSKLRRYNMYFSGSTTIITWQESEDSYIRVTVGASSMNMPIKSGKSTTGWMHEGTDKGKIKFFLPLSYKAKKRMGLWNFTQLTTDCLMCVSQAYEKIKKSFWSWLFELVMAPIDWIFSFVNCITDIALKWMGKLSFPVGNLLLFLHKHVNDLIDDLLVFGVSFVYKVLGPQLGTVALAVAMAVLTYFGAGSVALQIASMLLSRGTQLYNVREIENAQKELDAAKQTYDDFNETLTALKQEDTSYNMWDAIRNARMYWIPAKEVTAIIQNIQDASSNIFYRIEEIESAARTLVYLTPGINAASDGEVMALIEETLNKQT